MAAVSYFGCTCLRKGVREKGTKKKVQQLSEAKCEAACKLWTELSRLQSVNTVFQLWVWQPNTQPVRFVIFGVSVRVSQCTDDAILSMWFTGDQKIHRLCNYLAAEYCGGQSQSQSQTSWRNYDSESLQIQL